MLYISFATFLQFFQSYMWIWPFQEKPILGYLGYTRKVLNSEYMFYVICISQINLSPSQPVSEID